MCIDAWLRDVMTFELKNPEVARDKKYCVKIKLAEYKETQTTY